MNPTFAYTSRASAVESMSRVRPSGRIASAITFDNAVPRPRPPWPGARRLGLRRPRRCSGRRGRRRWGPPDRRQCRGRRVRVGRISRCRIGGWVRRDVGGNDGDGGSTCAQGEGQQRDGRKCKATKRSGYLVLLRWRGVRDTDERRTPRVSAGAEPGGWFVRGGSAMVGSAR